MFKATAFPNKKGHFSKIISYPLTMKGAVCPQLERQLNRSLRVIQSFMNERGLADCGRKKLDVLPLALITYLLYNICER